MAKWSLVRVDRETHEALKEIAATERKSVAQLIKDLLEKRKSAIVTTEGRPNYETGFERLEEAAKQPTRLEKDWQFWEIYHTLQSYFQKIKEEPKRLEELRERRIAEGAHPKIIERLDKEIEHFNELDGNIKTLDDFVLHLIQFWRETMKCPNTAEKLENIWRQTKRWLEGQS